MSGGLSIGHDLGLDLLAGGRVPADALRLAPNGAALILSFGDYLILRTFA